MKKSIIIVAAVFVVLIILGTSIGVKINMDNKKFQEEMVEIVKSEEAKAIYERVIYEKDPKALTPEGIIKSYEIDYDSVKHNPMGGIGYKIIFNGDENLDIMFHLDKYDGVLKNGAYSLSVDLAKQLGGYYE